MRVLWAAGWFVVRYPRLTSDAIVADAELRSAQSHHQLSGLTTSAAGRVHLRLSVLLCERDTEGNATSAAGTHNPARLRAERELEEFLNAPRSQPLTPGIAFVRQVRQALQPCVS
jgi:hypothetical protein